MRPLPAGCLAQVSRPPPFLAGLSFPSSLGGARSDRGVLLCLANDSFIIPFPSWRGVHFSCYKILHTSENAVPGGHSVTCPGAGGLLFVVAHSVGPSHGGVFSTGGGCSHPRLSAPTSGNAVGLVCLEFPSTLDRVPTRVRASKVSPGHRQEISLTKSARTTTFLA